MLATIDFSVFCSPTEAYGNITGDVEVPERVCMGDEVSVLVRGKESWFSGRLRVVAIHHLQGTSTEKVLLGLEDVVAPSLEEANNLVKRLESEKSLFFDKYHHES